MPKVTVLLTSYNHEEFIADSIESILNQTYTDFELYIVDDCSMDNSWEVIQKYNDPRIIAIHHEKNMFGCSNREFYKNFKGQYFAMAHCDDLWELDKLEKQVKYLDEHPEAGACFSWVQLIDDYGNNYDNPDHPYSKVFLEENMNRFEWLNHFFYNGNRLCHPSSLIRLNIQMNENLFPGGLGALPDFYRWIKLCLKHEIYVYPERLTKFRIHVDESNMSGQTPTNRIRVHNEFYQIAKLYGLIQDQSEFLKVFPEANEYVVDGKMNVDYALAPEFKFPKPLYSSYEAIVELLKRADELKLDSDHVMVMGHSAGGYISSCLTLMDRERQKIKIKGAILDYPPLRQEVDTELRKVADPSKAISENRMLQYINWYYNSFDELDDILASPLLADLHDLPKTLVISAEYDALKNEEKAYADKMREAGGDVEYYEFKNCRHGFTHECFNEYMPKESCEAWNLMSDFIKKVMASYED